jgi:pyridoxamine 5'-phosphate oxidase
MTKTEIYSFMTANPAFYIATCEGTQPRVRGLYLHKADENGIVFTTGKMRDLYKQLKMNLAVECIFHKENLAIRVTGKAVESEDMDLKNEIVAARPFMRPIIEKFGFEPMAVFIIKDCIATTWTMETTMAPKTFIEL